MSVKYVEYLEADGNSYFELPAGTITWNSNSGIEVQYYHNAYVDKSYLIGAYGLNGNTSIYTYYEQLGILMFEQRFTKNWDTNGYKANIQPYIHTIKIDKSGRTFDGVTESIAWSEPENWIFERINVSPVRIFGQGSNQGDNYKYVALQGTRIYYVKIYNGDEVVHYFRPCLKGNTPCMYDEISQTFYYNQGTGTFGYGKTLNTLHLFANNNQGTAENLGSYRLYNMKIDGDSEGVESGVDYVDCLIGDNDSWINTGIVAKPNYRIEATFTSTVDRYAYSVPEQKSFSAIWGASTSTGYSYDREPYGVSLSFKDTSVHVKNGGVLSSPVGISVSCLNKKYTHSVIVSENVTNANNLYLFAINFNGVTYNHAENTTKIYDFKIYNAQETLIQHLRPCLDTEGIPCMYDEVSKQYFYNQGSGTFGYKKKLRDFQPVLDSNGVPCLMDKVEKKYYYDKNGKGFSCDRYSGVSYLKGDYNSYIDTGLIASEMHGYKIEIKYVNATDMTNESTTYQQMLFGSSEGGLDKHDVNCHFRYSWYCYPQGLTFDSGIDYGAKNGTVIETNAIINTPTSSYSIYLFGTNGKNAQSDNHNACDATIYYWKVYDTNNNLIQHLIPAIDTDGSIGMYDLVTETFFYNQGTGEFSYGIEEEECPKVANAIDCIKKIGRNNDDYFRTKNFNGLINENLIIKTKIALGSLRDNNGAYFQTVGQYNMNRLYLGYNKNNNQLQYAFFGANDSVTLTDYDVFNDEVWEIELSKNGLTVNGVFIKSLESDITGTSLVVPLYIFQTVTYLDKPNGNALPGQKIYELIFEQDGQIIANFQPCLDDNGNLCFCDIVDNTYYYPTLGTSYEYNQLLQTPIKYIETNGTQYIDTGVVPTDNTDIDMVARAVAKEYTQVEYLQGDGDNYLNIGDWTFDMNTRVEVQVTAGTGNVLSNTLTTGTFYIARIEQGSLRTMWSGNTVFQGGQWFGSGINKAIVSTSPTETVITHEGTDYTSTSDITSFSANLNLQVFGQNAYATGAIKVHYLQIYESEILVFDGIPVLDNGGTPCMYDKVNNQYFYNQGTGTFAHGNAVDKNYLMNDFYIESTYKYKETDTTVEPNLTASEGATLTLGSTYMSYLSEEELEQATKNGWIIE